MNNDLCPICGSKLKITKDHLDLYGPLLEEMRICLNSRCKQYHYEYVTGYTREIAWNKNNEKDYVEVGYSYNTPLDDIDVKNMEKKLEEIIERLKVEYDNYYAPTGNSIVDNFEACDIL